MKKIININFHGRVVPIEETAYDILRGYVDQLHRHFAAEEGGDEIVNDIENRFAELFSDKLKKGSTCITDADVNEIIASMGRPEDFDQDETGNGKSAGTANAAGSFSYAGTESEDSRKSLYRSENDKMLGGVCGGIAAYLRIDSSLVRIIYALLVLGSFGTALLIYVILWIVLPPKSMATSVKKKLYRNPDQRVIAGVASGLAAYFNIEVWIPRLIFALPLIAGFVTSIFRHLWFDFDRGPIFFTGGLGGSLFVIYVILWIVLPEANSASEKLEMRGEKVDIESIKNTIKSDLEGFRQKAAVVGDEMKSQARQFGNQFRESSTNFTRNVSSSGAARGIGHAIGVLFRVFFLCIAAIVTFALVAALIGLMFTGAGVLPLKHYVFTGFWENILAWAAVLLFLVLPVVGLLTWLIRRIIGARSGSNYLGYIFGTLWVIGLICLLALIASVSADFRTRSAVSEDINMTAPDNGRLEVKVSDIKPVVFDSDWMGIHWARRSPFIEVNEDSITLNTVRIDVEKSNDSNWHLRREKLSRGNSSAEARSQASQINFDVQQRDSVLYLPAGFSLRPGQQFRNQQVVLVIEIPVGKKIRLDGSLDDFYWFDLGKNKWRNHRFQRDEEDWDDNDQRYSWSTGVDYVMTDHGLERASGRSVRESKERPEQQEKPEQPEQIEKPENPENPGDGYRYHKSDSKKQNEDKKTDELKKVTTGIQPACGNSPAGNCSMGDENYSPLVLFTEWS